MLAAAKEKALPNTSFVRTAAERLPFPDSSFSVVGGHHRV